MGGPCGELDYVASCSADPHGSPFPQSGSADSSCPKPPKDAKAECESPLDAIHRPTTVLCPNQSVTPHNVAAILHRAPTLDEQRASSRSSKPAAPPDGHLSPPSSVCWTLALTEMRSDFSATSAIQVSTARLGRVLLATSLDVGDEGGVGLWRWRSLSLSLALASQSLRRGQGISCAGSTSTSAGPTSRVTSVPGPWRPCSTSTPSTSRCTMISGPSGSMIQ